MSAHNYIRYYRVFEHDTAVTAVSANDFKVLAIRKFKRGLPVSQTAQVAVAGFQYSLLPEGSRFYGYLDQQEALAKAKSGALAYINLLTRAIEAARNKLEQYRFDHYEDLNFNLVPPDLYRLKRRRGLPRE